MIILAHRGCLGSPTLQRKAEARGPWPVSTSHESWGNKIEKQKTKGKRRYVRYAEWCRMMQNDAEWSNFGEMLYNVESFDVFSRNIIIYHNMTVNTMVYRYESCFYGECSKKKNWTRFKTCQEIGAVPWTHLIWWSVLCCALIERWFSHGSDTSDVFLCGSGLCWLVFHEPKILVTECLRIPSQFSPCQWVLGPCESETPLAPTEASSPRSIGHVSGEML